GRTEGEPSAEARVQGQGEDSAMNVDDRRVARLRLQPASDFEHLLQLAARVALVIIGTIAVAVALDHGQLLFAPVVMAVVIGLMFGPLADRIESVGIPSGVS